MCKAHTDQSMYKLYTTSEKKELTSPQTAKNLFSNMYVIDTTCFENVFYSIWDLDVAKNRFTNGTYLSIDLYRCHEVLLHQNSRYRIDREPKKTQEE